MGSKYAVILCSTLVLCLIQDFVNCWDYGIKVDHGTHHKIVYPVIPPTPPQAEEDNSQREVQVDSSHKEVEEDPDERAHNKQLYMRGRTVHGEHHRREYPVDEARQLDYEADTGSEQANDDHDKSAYNKQLQEWGQYGEEEQDAKEQNGELLSGYFLMMGLHRKMWD